jgi:hypothetical protein
MYTLFLEFFETFKMHFLNVQNKGLQWAWEPNRRTHWTKPYLRGGGDHHERCNSPSHRWIKVLLLRFIILDISNYEIEGELLWTLTRTYPLIICKNKAKRTLLLFYVCIYLPFGAHIAFTFRRDDTDSSSTRHQSYFSRSDTSYFSIVLARYEHYISGPRGVGGETLLVGLRLIITSTVPQPTWKNRRM